MSCLTSDINVFICQIITFEHPTATVCRVYSDLGGLNPFFFTFPYKFGFIYTSKFLQPVLLLQHSSKLHIQGVVFVVF